MKAADIRDTHILAKALKKLLPRYASSQLLLTCLISPNLSALNFFLILNTVQNGPSWGCLQMGGGGG